jgi:hypothetical protein
MDMTFPYIVLLTVIYFLSTLLSFSYFSCYGWFGAFSLSSLLNLTLYRPTKYLEYFFKNSLPISYANNYNIALYLENKSY